MDTNTCFLGPDGTGFYPEDPWQHNNPPEHNNIPRENNYSHPSVPDPASCELLNSDELDGGKTLGPNACYRVEGTLSAANGVVTIKPDTTIFFDHHARFVVTDMGRIQVEGSELEPVRLAGSMDERGFWVGIQIYGTGGGENFFHHAIIQNAGSQPHDEWEWSTGALYVGDRHNGDFSARVDIDQVLFQDNLGSAITQPNGASKVTVANTIFAHNEIPLTIPWGGVGGYGDSLTFLYNDNAYIRINARKDGTQGGEQTWHNYGIPYYLVDSVALTDTHITIEPGTTLLFSESVSLYAEKTASLHAVGTSDKPIIFTSENRTQGGWGGVGFYSTNTKNELGFVELHYAGGAYWRSLERSPGAIGVRNDGRLTIHDATITNARGDGIVVYSESGFAAALHGCENLTFENIEGADISSQESPADISICKP